MKSTHSNSYTKGVKPVIRRIERLREKGESFKQEPPRQAIARTNYPKTESGDLTSRMSARGLAKRLGVSHPVIGKMKNRGADIFADWSKEKDPDGLTWELQGDKYYPLPPETGKVSY